MNSLQLTLAARYLWGRKLRTVLTTLAIVFGTLVIFATNILLPTMLQAFQTNVLAASGQVDVTITHKTGETFSRNLVSEVRTIDGVRAISGSLSRTVNIPTGYFGHGAEDVTALTLSGIDPRAAEELHNYPIESGRFLLSGDTKAAVITTSLAKAIGVGLGDSLTLPTTEGAAKLEIIGLLPARTLPGNEEVLVTLLQAQKLLDQPKRINIIELNLDTTDSTRRDTIIAAIKSDLGPDFTMGALTGGNELLASMQMGQMAFNVMGFLALFMGGFIIFNTFRTVVAERRHDIGMLRSIGARRSTIAGIILTEGLVQGVIGTLVGMVLGYLIGAGGLRLLSGALDNYMHLKMGAPVVTPGLIITTLILGVGVTLLAGLLPALNAGRVSPIEALRPAAGERQSRPSLTQTIIGLVLIGGAVAGLITGNTGLTALGGVMFLIGLVLIAPVVVRPLTTLFSSLIALIFARDGTGMLAQSNMVRQPSRAAITASTTMIGLAVIVGLGGMIWSLTGGFLTILQRSLGSDYLIMPPSLGVWGTNIGAKKELGEQLREIPGVYAVSSFRFASAEVNGDTISLLGIDPAEYAKVASLTFQDGSAEQAYQTISEERAIIANGILAAQLGIKAGDTVTLTTPRGEKTYQVAGVAGDFLNAKISTAYISQKAMASDFRKTEDIMFQLNLDKNADSARVEEKMKAVLAKYPQFKLVSGKNYYQENRKMFDVVFVFYFFILAILAAPSLIALINTLAIGVIERTREIGMVRAIGAKKRQVRRMVVVESLLLAGIGTLFGLLGGLYLGYVMVLGLAAGGFPVEYMFPYQGLAAAIFTGFAFGLLAAVVPSRQAVKMDIIRALRFE